MPSWDDIRPEFRSLYADLGPQRLADRIGVHRNTVYEWEQGKATPRGPYVHMIAGAVAKATKAGDEGGAGAAV